MGNLTIYLVFLFKLLNIISCEDGNKIKSPKTTKVLKNLYQIYLKKTKYQSNQFYQNKSTISETNLQKEMYYYYIELYISNILQSLILDTSSELTGSICKPYGKIFYKDYNNLYNLSSNKIINSKNNEKCILLVNDENKCEYNNKEGAYGINMIYYEEHIELKHQYLDTYLNNTKIITNKIPFGCISDLKYPLSEMKTEGVLGLANSNYSFIDVLYKYNVTNSKLFTICIGDILGYFSLGEINTFYHLSNEISYNSLVQSDIDKNSFAIEVDKVKIYNEEITANTTAILNSGSSISYFPSEIYKIINGLIINKCLDKTFCNFYYQSNDTGLCFKLKQKSLINKVLNFLPNIYYIIGNNFYKSSSLDYYIEYKEEGYYIVCLGIASWEKNYFLFGNNFFRNHDIIFDKENNRIGFVESNCNKFNRYLINKIPKANFGISNDGKSFNFYNNANKFFPFLILFLCFLILFFLIGIRFMQKGKRYLCFNIRYGKLVGSEDSSNINNNEKEMVTDVKNINSNNIDDEGNNLNLNSSDNNAIDVLDLDNDNEKEYINEIAKKYKKLELVPNTSNENSDEEIK